MILLTASCGDSLDGKYISVDSVFGEVIEIDGDSIAITSSEASMKGTFTLSDGEMTMYLSGEDEESVRTVSFSRHGGSIFLNGKEYVRGDEGIT